MRKILATYIKDTHIIEPLGDDNSNDSISIEESLFTHKDQQQLWSAGLINNRIKVILLEIVKEKTSDINKKFINIFVSKDNIINTDGNLCYSWLNKPDSGYAHHVHNRVILVKL